MGGMISLGWRAVPGTYIGLGLGAGTDELGQTLRPRDKQLYHDFEQYLHLDLFLRHKPRPRFDFDLGLRGGFGEVRNCDGCDLPAAFAGVYGSVFVGSARWKLGTGLIAARVVDGSSRDNVVHWEVITLRYTR